MEPRVRESLQRLDEITRRLRVECPWDREQDARSIVPHTVEESYELADAARRGDAEAMVDELGDVLFQVLFLSLLLEERGEGDLGAVAESCAAKLIRRHPHVYGAESGGASSASRPGAPSGGASSASRPGAPSGGASSASRPGAPRLESAGEVLAQWETIKREVEGAPEPHRALPEAMPALLYARKLLKRAEPEGAATGGKPGGPGADAAARDAAEREVGEALLEAVRSSRRLGVDPELALRRVAQERLGE